MGFLHPGRQVTDAKQPDARAVRRMVLCATW
jgi:hypothetical protein